MNKNKISIIFGIFFAITLLQSVQAANVDIQAFNYSPSPAFPGQNIQVTATLTNNSIIDAENVVFRLVLSDENNARYADFPFILHDENAFKSIGTIKPKESAVVQFSVGVSPEALNGNYTISMMAGDLGVLNRTKKFTINILSRKPRIELIESSSSSISPGEEKTIELKVKNVGSSKALNILVGIEEDRTVTSGGIVVERSIYPIGNAFYYIDSLSPNEEKSVSLKLSADSGAESRTYTVPIKLQWQDENRSDSSLTRFIGLRVVGEPLFDIIIDEVEPLAFAGGTSGVTFNLFNAGVAEAQNIVIELSTNAGIIEKNKVFIGALEADDSDSFKTSIELSKDLQPGEYPITAKISYKNAALEPRELLKTVNLRVVSQEQAKSGTENGLLNVGIGIVILAVVGYYFYRRRKNQNKNK